MPASESLRNLWFAALFGAVGGPLAYLGASRGFGAVAVASPDLRGLVWLAMGWAVAMTLMALGARRWSAAMHKRGSVVAGGLR